MLSVSFRNFLFTLLLFAAVFGSWWLIKTSTNDHAKNSPASTQTTPDTFMKQVTYISTDAAGNLSSHLVASNLFHFEKNNSSTYSSPKFTIYVKSGEPWFVSAENGESFDGIHKIILKNKVYVHQNAGPHNNEFSMYTSELTILPKLNLAKTNQAVTIQQPGGTVHATGLTANLKTGEIKLISRAEGQYDPIKK